MKRYGIWSVVACAVLGLSVLAHGPDRSANAQDGAKKAAAKKGEKTKKGAKKAPKKKARGRLPQYYGQIGLSEKQRADIYAVQATYRTQIQDLLKQLAALRAKEKAEINAVLSDEQKQDLAKRLDEASKSRSKKGGAKPKPKKAAAESGS